MNTVSKRLQLKILLLPMRAGWFFTVLLGLAPFPANAGAAPGEIQWNELAALIVGHNVVIPLGGGIVVQGEALSVRENSLILDIRKTTEVGQYPKGQTTIARDSVTEVRIAEHRGNGGRVLGAIVGALVGVIGGAEIAVHGTQSEAAGVSLFSAVAVSSAVAGYYAGRSADRHSRLLHIAPAMAGSTLPIPLQR